MSWLFNKPDEEIVAVFDIGNGSIGCAIVRLSPHGKPTVLYNHRQPMAFLQHVTSERLLDTMVKLLKSVSQHVGKEVWPQYRRQVRRAFCFFSSPWYMSQTRVLTIEKEKPFTVTSDLIEDIFKKDAETFAQEQKTGTYEKMFGQNLHLLEKNVIHIKLNGYELPNPVNKKARILELTFFASFIAETIQQKIEDILQAAFHFKSISMNSFALASWVAVRDMFPTENSFLILDITGEVTDIMLTETGVLAEIISFPAGRSLILRKIVDELAVPPEVALSFLKLHNKGLVEKKFQNKMEDIIKAAQKTWSEALTETLSLFTKQKMMPQKMFVTVDDDVAPIFLEVLRQNTFTVVHLGEEMIQDPFVILESTFINKAVV
ncbi:hypothetical protein KW782_03495 [Candidatus Parcubacteria bacterium]|nr:hypothetical protein [Candidatus Parcubacteria bacterium]